MTCGIKEVPSVIVGDRWVPWLMEFQIFFLDSLILCITIHSFANFYIIEAVWRVLCKVLGRSLETRL